MQRLNSFSKIVFSTRSIHVMRGKLKNVQIELSCMQRIWLYAGARVISKRHRPTLIKLFHTKNVPKLIHCTF